MGNKKSVLKVFVDQKENKVLFAEAEEDFVEILFSFFTLPLGTIARLLRKLANSNNTKVGSLSSLYESVVNLNVTHFSEEWYKSSLVKPVNSSAPVCQKLKVNLQDEIEQDCRRQCDAVFLKKKAKFIITDDLKVVPVVLDTSIALLNSLGVENIDLLEERTMDFGLEEFSNLLKWSLISNNPLTNLVLGGNNPCSSNFTSTIFSNPAFMSSNSGETQKVKLLVQKSKKKVLCAQVENCFVELLFSFLTIPLGAYIRLTKDDSSPLGISNLYKSIPSLADEKYLKSDDAKTILLCPKVADTYKCVTALLPIYEVDACPGSFLKEQVTFLVTDDLKVIATPSIATISKYYTTDVPTGDMELLELIIGEQEALLLLKASLTSTSALTDCLKAFGKKAEDHATNSSFAEDGGRDSEEEEDFTNNNFSEIGGKSSEEEADFTLIERNDIDAKYVLLN